MSAQLSYSINQAVALAGMIADLANKNIVSRSVETVAGADFGIAVSRGTDKDKQVVIGGADYLGVTVRDVARESDGTNGTIKYLTKDTAAIMREGYIYCVIPAGGNPGDPILFTDATGIIDVGTAGAGETQIAGATLETVTTAGGLGVVRLTA